MSYYDLAQVSSESIIKRNYFPLAKLAAYQIAENARPLRILVRTKETEWVIDPSNIE